MACYGPTGGDVLLTLSRNFESITAEPEWVRDMVIMLALAAVPRHQSNPPPSCSSAVSRGCAPFLLQAPRLLYTLKFRLLCNACSATVDASAAPVPASSRAVKADTVKQQQEIVFTMNSPGKARQRWRVEADVVEVGGATSQEGASVEGGVELAEELEVHAKRVEPKAGTTMAKRGITTAMPPLSNAAGVAFDACDCTYVIPDAKTGGTVLVKEFSCHISAGEVLALLGPSGAGKTTLLNMLTMRRSRGRAYGRVMLNGQPFTMGAYRRHASMVMQNDLLWPFLSAREHLAFSVALYQPGLDELARGEFVDSLLKETGLERAQHTIAGLPPLLKGLSGGEKRRLSLGIALAKKPSLIFLDEPTSGLDAAAQAFITRFLKQMAIRLQLCIFCTMHAPSSSVFAGFDGVCFLTGGRMAYIGKAAALSDYLESVGWSVPRGSNPADFMLDLLNRDFDGLEAVDELLGAWQSRMPEQSPPAVAALPSVEPVPASRQLLFLLRKHLLLLRRDPVLVLARVVLLPVCTCFIAILYLRTRDLSQTTALNRWVRAGVSVSVGVRVGVGVRFTARTRARARADANARARVRVKGKGKWKGWG